jgi:hypothetical protein
VIGRGVFSSAIASVLGPEISGELNHLFNPKEKAREPMLVFYSAKSIVVDYQ